MCLKLPWSAFSKQLSVKFQRIYGVCQKIHFLSKIGPQLYDKMGHVWTNNGVASAKRYPWGRLKRYRVSVGVLYSYRLDGSTDFCALSFLMNRGPVRLARVLKIRKAFLRVWCIYIGSKPTHLWWLIVALEVCPWIKSQTWNIANFRRVQNRSFMEKTGKAAV